MRRAKVVLVTFVTVLVAIGLSTAAWSEDESGGIRPEQKRTKAEKAEEVTLPKAPPIKPVPIMNLRCYVKQIPQRGYPHQDILINFMNMGLAEIPPGTEIVYSLPRCSDPECRGEYTFKEALKRGEIITLDVYITHPVADLCEVRFKKYPLEP